MTKLWRDARGVVVPVVAITLPVLLVVTGLGVEAGLWYTIKRHNQTAADFAALSGALEVEAAQGYQIATNYAEICALAKQDAANNGFAPAGFACPTSTPACTTVAQVSTAGGICVNYPPEWPNGSHIGDTSYVEVVVEQQQNTLFASLALPTVSIVNRATAYVKKYDDSCLLAVGSTGADVYVQGGSNAIINSGTCSISSDSTSANAFNLVGNPTITAGTLVTPGGVTGHMNNVSLQSPPLTGVVPVVDPYASTYTHTYLQAGMPATCTAAPAANAAYTTDVRFCGGLTIGAQTIDLQPPSGGHLTVWITDGDLSLTKNSSLLECTTCTFGGAGVTIILTKSTAPGAVVGGVSIKNGNITSLNAPCTACGGFTGLLLAQDPAGPFDTPATTGSQCKNVSSPCSTFGGNGAATSFNGIVYFPGTSMYFIGNPSATANGCFMLVVKQIEVAGSANLNDTGCPSVLGVPHVTTVVLAE